jgi:hypothetical protein
MRRAHGWTVGSRAETALCMVGDDMGPGLCDLIE